MTIGSKLQLLVGSTLPTETTKLALKEIKSKFDREEVLSISDANFIDEIYNSYIDKDENEKQDYSS